MACCTYRDPFAGAAVNWSAPASCEWPADKPVSWAKGTHEVTLAAVGCRAGSSSKRVRVSITCWPVSMSCTLVYTNPRSGQAALNDVSPTAAGCTSGASSKWAGASEGCAGLLQCHYTCIRKPVTLAKALLKSPPSFIPALLRFNSAHDWSPYICCQHAG